MQAAMLVMLGALAGYEMRRMTFLRRCGYPRAALRRYKRLSLMLGLTIWGAMLCQEAVLLLSGSLHWQTGLPLHLCSLAGVLTLPMLLTGSSVLWHFALCLGLPGAVLALIYPAIPQTAHPMLARASFCLLHAGLVIAPMLPFALGRRPTLRGAGEAWLALMVLGAAAMAVNGLLGSNYLFLRAPVPGTPLEWLARGGLGRYRLRLASASALLLLVEGLLARKLWGMRG